MSSDNYSRTEQAVWMRERAKAWERLKLPPPLFQLRQKLGQKAKQEPRFRFYSLYTIAGSTAWCAVLAWIGIKAGQDEALMRGELHRITLWAAGAFAVLGGIAGTLWGGAMVGFAVGLVGLAIEVFIIAMARIFAHIAAR